MGKYNIKLLLAEADCLTIADMLGINGTKKGKNHYIECPEHFKRTGKRETKFDNCILNERGYYCFSCGASGSIIKLVQNHQNKTEDEACKIICDLLGNEDRYIYAGKKAYFPLTKEEVDAIGLLPYVKCENVLNMDIDKKQGGSYLKIISPKYRVKEEKRKSWDLSADYYLFGTYQTESLYNLYEEDKNAFTDIIVGKAKEAYNTYDWLYRSKLADMFLSPEMSYTFKGYAKRRRRICADILDRFGIVVPLSNAAYAI